MLCQRVFFPQNCLTSLYTSTILNALKVFLPLDETDHKAVIYKKGNISLMTRMCMVYLFLETSWSGPAYVSGSKSWLDFDMNIAPR